MGKAKKEPDTKAVDNLAFWNSVCETNPAITKDVNYGKRHFTAIDAQHQLKRATELWGPYGKEWGVKNTKFGYVGKGNGDPIELTVDAVFFCPLSEFEISSDIKFEAGGECRKKVLTDLTTKALSKLGFNSDVFEGKFDDNKYVTEMKKKHATPEKKTKPTKEEKPVPEDGPHSTSPGESKITPDGLTYLDEIKGMLQTALGGGMGTEDAGKKLHEASTFDGEKGHQEGWTSLSQLIDDAHDGKAREGRLKVIRDRLKPILAKKE